MTIRRLRLHIVRRYTEPEFRRQVLFAAIAWAIVFLALVWPIFDKLFALLD
jgi:hypothetical protein